MTYRAIRRLLAEVKCRPGWKVSAEKVFHGPSEVMLVVQGRVQDAGHPRRSVKVEQVEFLPEFETLDARGILRRVLRLLDQVERHETREWFRWRGTRPFDPHKILS